MNLIDLISSKIELYRLEQRYTRRHNRRSTFVSDALYVDGEYVYNKPPKKDPQHTGGSSASEASSSTSTSSTTQNTRTQRSTISHSSLPGTTRAQSRMQREGGNSLIEEVNAELERAEREHEMEVEDMLEKLEPLAPKRRRSAVVPSQQCERKSKNPMRRLSVRDFKWDSTGRRGDR